MLESLLKNLKQLIVKEPTLTHHKSVKTIVKEPTLSHYNSVKTIVKEPILTHYNSVRTIVKEPTLSHYNSVKSMDVLQFGIKIWNFIEKEKGNKFTEYLSIDSVAPEFITLMTFGWPLALSSDTK